MIVISDTSPITSLIAIGRTDILAELFAPVLIPRAVYDELIAFHSTLPDFLVVKEASDTAKIAGLRRQLGKGEAEAIALAEELAADALLLDDASARLIAEQRHLPVVGLVGVLILAKRRGLIQSLGSMLNQLQAEAGFYLAPTVRADAIRSAGEPAG